MSDETKQRKFSNEVKKHFLEIVSTYSKYQESMDRKSDIIEIAETLGGITEAARELALNESDDWFDSVTIKRNMSELTKLGTQFDKVATEAKSLDQRLVGLYEDMGHILSRYYKVGDISEETMKQRLGIRENKKSKCKCGGKCGCSHININESSRRATDFFKETKYGLAINKLLRNKWDESKVKRFLEQLGGGSDMKYIRIMDYIANNLGLDPLKYNTYNDMESDLLDKMKSLYTDFHSKSEAILREANGRLNKKVKQYIDTYLENDKSNSPDHQFAVMMMMKGALHDANFHSEAKELDKFFPKAKQVDPKWLKMKDTIEDKGVQISKWAKWDGYDIIDAFSYYANMVFGSGFGNKLETLKESIINESFTKQQLTTLQDKYSDIRSIDPSSPTYKKLTDFLDRLKTPELKQLADANIKWVSMLAGNRVNRKSTNENVNEAESLTQSQKLLKSVNGNEIKFYNKLEQLYEKLGFDKYMVWLSKSLKDFGVNMEHNPKIKNKEEAEEYLYDLSK